MLNVDFIRQVGTIKWLTRYSWLLARKRVFKLETSLRLPTGSLLVLPNHSSSATEVFVTNANIDWGSEALFTHFADPERDFLDIGAHIGYYSVYLSPRVRRVYAFEPDRRNLPSLQANALAAGNVEVVEMAASSRDGVALLGVGGGSAVSSLTSGNDGEPVVSVKTTTIDSFVGSREGIDVALVKIDAEGHDLEVLRGMHHLVIGHLPLILTECSLDSELRKLCNSWNYRIFAYVRDRNTLQTRFLAMTEGLEDPLYKMSFLVPQRLVSAFAQLTSDDRQGNRHG